MGKRQLECPEPDELHSNKRLRTNSHIENHLEIAPMFGHLDDKRRASESLQRTHPSRNYSPTLSDSWAGSVHPHQHSPGFHGRSPKPPPSPSSMAATSHRASLSSHTVQPGRSSTTAPSSYTAPTSTAASQHIADLQHQVTLKSLSLQTLQSEYTSLLQKFQKDRLKSQSFEKKTNAADQEVNELTMRNDELTEQVKTLSMQLEDCEKKREAERSDAVREKEQWGRMLEMSGRLQAKSADDRQKLVQEKIDLEQRLLIRENEAAINASKGGSSPATTAGLTGQRAAITETEKKTADEQSTAQLIALQRDNHVLQTRTNMLRSTLERVESHYASIMEKRREMLEQELAQIPGAIAAALQEDGAFSRQTDSTPNLNRSASGFGLTGRNSVDLSLSQEKHQSHILLEKAAKGAGAVENIALPSTPSTTTDHAANSNSNPPTHQSNTAPSKNATNSRLKAVPLPKWQPPSTSALRTEHLSNNQRRPSGPATPYPGSESSQWQSLNPKPTALPGPDSKSSPPPSNPLPPLFSMEKSPARDYSSQYIPPAQSSSSASNPEKSAQQKQPPVATAMPPPPRPGGGGGAVPSQPAAASWRPSL